MGCLRHCFKHGRPKGPSMAIKSDHRPGYFDTASSKGLFGTCLNRSKSEAKIFGLWKASGPTWGDGCLWHCFKHGRPKGPSMATKSYHRPGYFDTASSKGLFGTCLYRSKSEAKIFGLWKASGPIWGACGTVLSMGAPKDLQWQPRVNRPYFVIDCFKGLIRSFMHHSERKCKIFWAITGVWTHMGYLLY